MEKIVCSKLASLFDRPHRLRAVGMSWVLSLVMSATAFAQQITITGTVTSADRGPLRAVTVRVLGTETSALTNDAGKYTVTAPANATLVFTLLGQKAVQTAVGARTVIDVQMERVAFLDVVLVTAYATEQRRGDITGAVSSVDLETVEKQTTASVLQRLDVAVPGVRVENSGSPGGRSTVRIRGISSFQNNDPLYIVDGTPVQDSYINFLNPNDIASVQVLKDASSASIYGSRASNGVVIIETTKRGAAGPPQATLRVRTGVATPVRGYDDFLIKNSLDYFQVIKQSYKKAGLPLPPEVLAIYGDSLNPTIPRYTYVDSKCTGCITATDAFGRPTAVNEAGYSFPNVLIMPASSGTNWWKEVFGPAPVSDYNLDVAGGGLDTRYAVSFNYFDQEGTAAYNRFQRGSARVNTSFNRRRLTVGENISISLQRSNGGVGDDGFGEGGFIGKNILSQPVVPVRDIAGNFASGKGVGLGNNTNPLKAAWAARDNVNRNERIFGNVFAGLELPYSVSLRSSLGFNVGQGGTSGFNAITPENSEPNFTNSIFENSNRFTDYTLSNTLRAGRQFGSHNLNLLLGQEANRSWSRFITAGLANLISENPDSWYVQDALGDAGSKNVSSSGGRSTLLSFFGKVDYSFADRYIASVTVRKDGSSRLGPENRWGTFPAFGLGWKISEESFLANNTLLSDVLIRYGWGVTGNQAIPAGRIVSAFGGGRDQTFYDIGGNNTNLIAGFRQTSLGNPDLKWEESRSQNVGLDLGLFDGRINIVADLYQRTTDNLLFDPPTPATAGQSAPPIVNIGEMENKGIDFSIGHRAVNWGVSLNGSKYSNKIVRIDGVQNFFYGPISTRFGNQVINRIGSPIGSFYGLINDGMFQTQAEIDALNAAARAKPGATPTTLYQDGAKPGRLKFRDTNGDGRVTLADRDIIGNPHPDFTAGLDMDYRWRSFDLSATLFGSFGNDIFDVQKEFYVFRNFSTNVRSDLLANSWSTTNTGAKYPALDVSDTYSYQVSSFYVEDGSYVRMRSLQLGWAVPNSMRLLGGSRLYLQAENLFTITGYDGLDPALPAANVFGAAGDIRDQYRGVDRGTYPSNRIFSIGLSTTF